MMTAIVTIIIFLVLISLHEFGHFIMSKLSGVRVIEFSIGMGPAIFKKQGAETLYSLRIFPVGGYCKLEGEDEETDDPKAFCNQKLYKRFLVVAAGAILNVILGFVLFVVITAVEPHPEGTPNTINLPVIDTVLENSYLAETGIQSGDRIVEINGHKIYFYNDIGLYTDKFSENTQARITVKRDGKKYTYDVMPSVSETVYRYGESSVEVTTSINGIKETNVYEYDERNIEEAKKVVGQTANEKRLIIGFTPKSEAVGLNNIFVYAFHYTGFVVRMVYRAFWDMLTGAAGFDQVSGPVGIVTAVNTAVNTGAYRLVNILYLTALLTINLGVFNLLPLPALDGGRLFFMLIELVRRKPVPPEKEGMVHAIGLILLLCLTVVISFNDIIKLIK